MNSNFVVLLCLLGLTCAFPQKSLKSLHSRLNRGNKGRLGIYDGKNTTIAKNNYIAGILIDDEYSCAGVILNKHYVITLADCAKGLTASDLTVVVGSSDGTTGTSYSVKKIITHPDYGSSEFDYDFALLKVKSTITFGTDVGSVTLPSSDSKSSAAMTIVGYGYTSKDDVTEGILLKGTMKWMSASNCEDYYSGYDFSITDRMACVYNKGKTTMCDGDFGDPVVKGKVLYGLLIAVSATNYCTSSAIPVIVADIYSVLSWIQKYV